MQFIDDVTIYHKTQEGYDMTYVEDVYWYGDTKLNISGNGVVREDSISVFFPKKVIDKYRLEINQKDYIVKGKGQPMTSVKDLAKYKEFITVRTVQNNIAGSVLDNILAIGS